MFTGIIEAQGTLTQRTPHASDQTLSISSDDIDFSQVKLGDSIAVNGVCLTAVELGSDYFSADVSNESLTHTTLGQLTIGQQVNLELALTLNKPLGGHLVSGHVDGVGELLSRHADARSERLTFTMPSAISHYIASKGSITIDGISLTVNSVSENTFSVNIVPHTLAKTTLAHYAIGQAVNLEVDLVARYIERLLQKPDTDNKLSIDTLRQHGF